MSGENPMRWDCERRGCFNKKKRPKIEQFSECLPGKCAFGDVDGLAEINGHGLFLEWKPAPVDIRTGQRLTYERLTKTSLISVICIAGDAESMVVTHQAKFFRGKFYPWKTASIEDVKKSIRSWVKWTAGGTPP